MFEATTISDTDIKSPTALDLDFHTWAMTMVILAGYSYSRTQNQLQLVFARDDPDERRRTRLFSEPAEIRTIQSATEGHKVS